MTLKTSAIMKGASPSFTCMKQPEEPKTKTEGPAMNQGERVTPAFEAGKSVSRRKKWGGGQLKSLKTLDFGEGIEAF